MNPLASRILHADLEQAALVKTTATPSPAKEAKRSESSQKSQQTPPKGEPRRLQWDTSNVNKARNAQRFPHQASPAGGAGRRVRPDSAKSTSSWNSARDSQPSPSQNSVSDSHRYAWIVYVHMYTETAVRYLVRCTKLLCLGLCNPLYLGLA